MSIFKITSQNFLQVNDMSLNPGDILDCEKFEGGDTTQIENILHSRGIDFSVSFALDVITIKNPFKGIDEILAKKICKEIAKKVEERSKGKIVNFLGSVEHELLSVFPEILKVFKENDLTK